ncbi:MAG: NYN domain-containing protein [Acidobacteria bacterium]|nr:NYN domain-containing protein [Acidobacteriota bacterium]
MDQIEQIAVFLDVENLIGFCTNLQLPIDIADVIEKLKDDGRITVRRSFGDIKRSLVGTNLSHEEDKVRRMLRDHLFLHEDIPYITQYKNSADMRLAVEALYTAFTIPSISKFAIISGDSDYVPLFLKLKEQNKTVIGITGSDRSTAVIYRRACDSLFYFEDLSRSSISSPESDFPEVDSHLSGVRQDSPEDHIRSEQATLKDEFASLLVRAVQVVNNSGKTASISAVQQQMRQLQADFDHKRAGFSSFNDLVRYAVDRQMIHSDDSKEDVLSLPGEITLTGQKQAISTAQYRMFVQERLKCQLPGPNLRNHICEQAATELSFSIEDGGILLRDLSHDVTDGLAGRGINIPQAEVFKFLYTLFRARCFSFEQTEYGSFNPLLTGLRAQKAEWDDHFVMQQLKSIDNEGFAMYADKLSQLFYETDAKAMQIKQMLNSLAIKFE